MTIGYRTILAILLMCSYCDSYAIDKKHEPTKEEAWLELLELKKHYLSEFVYLSHDELSKERLHERAVKKLAHESMRTIHSHYSHRIENDKKRVRELRKYLFFDSEKDLAIDIEDKLQLILEKNNSEFCLEMEKEQEIESEDSYKKSKLALLQLNSEKLQELIDLHKKDNAEC